MIRGDQYTTLPNCIEVKSSSHQGFFSEAARKSALRGTRLAASDGHKIWFVDWCRSHGPALAGMGAEGHVRAVPGTSKLVSFGHTEAKIGKIDHLGGFVRGPLFPFWLKIAGYSQDT